MATYRAIASSETDPQSPLTSTLVVALAQNPLAIQEGDDTAPRISPRAQGFTSIAGSSSEAALTLSGFGNYDGVKINIMANADSIFGDIQIQLSTDGTTFTTAVSVSDGGGGVDGGLVNALVTIDLSTGAYLSAWGAPATVGSESGTITGFTGDVTHIRISTPSGAPSFSALATVSAGIVA